MRIYIKEHLHFGHTLPDITVIQVTQNVDLLPTNAKLGRIMRILEINIWLFETLFVLSIQIFEGQYFLYEGCKLIAFHVLTMSAYANIGHKAK